jgi:hypothetical protein
MIATIARFIIIPAVISLPIAAAHIAGEPQPAPAPAVIEVAQASGDRDAAVRELLAHVEAGGRVYEDLSFAGMSGNLGLYNDEIADLFYEGSDIAWPEDHGRLAPFLHKLLEVPATGEFGGQLMYIQGSWAKYADYSGYNTVTRTYQPI